MKLPESYTIMKFYQFAGFASYKRGSKVYTASCPTCREGKSWGKKKRLYYIPKEDYLICHNCQRSWKPVNWVMEQSGMSFAEVLNESKDYDNELDKIDEGQKRAFPKSETLPKDSINLFNPQQLQYYKDNVVVQDALSLIRQRRLDSAINKPSALYLSLNDFIHKNRLCIPFFDSNGKIKYYQTRSIYKKDEIDRPKYLSKLNAEKTVYGVQNIDSSLDYLFIFEGPIDSFFVNNGIAMAGITLSDKQEEELNRYTLFNKIWVLDNQLDNKDVKRKLKQLVEKGESIFIWPKEFSMFKDLNDICVAGKKDKIKPQFFIDNSCEGIEALLKLN